MSRVLTAFLILTASGSFALGGVNEGGTIVVQALSEVEYTSDQETYCEAAPVPSDCADLGTELPSDDGAIHAWSVLAAFPPDASPRLSGLVFGVDYNDEGVVIVDHGMCGNFMLPDNDWPDPGTGVAVTFNPAQESHVTEAYWFAGYAYPGRDTYFRLAAHPWQGAEFVDDAVPGVIDQIADFGELGFGNALGYLPCPDAAGACCLPSGVCELQREVDCAGTWLGSSHSCDPDPCVWGACCIPGSECRVLTEVECIGLGGDYLAQYPCESNACDAATGACCFEDGTCQVRTEAHCSVDRGEWTWEGVSCSPEPCGNEFYRVEADGSGDIPTIQGAINAAADGSVIELGDGVFSGDGNRGIDFLGKSIVLRSGSGDAAACVIDAEGEDHVLYFRSGEAAETRLQDVTVRDGHAQEGAGIFIDGASPTIQGCVFETNSGPVGSGTFARNSAVQVEDCTFRNNRGAVFYAIDCAEPVAVRGSRFVANSEAPTAFFASHASVDFEACTFWGNLVSDSCIHVRHGNLSVRSCTFVRNLVSSTHYGMIDVFRGDLDISRSILAFNDARYPVTSFTGDVVLSCSDVFGNSGGDYIEDIQEQNGRRGNISQDPLFCDLEAGDLRLDPDSPCAPGPAHTVTACERMGAESRGCSPLATGSLAHGSALSTEGTIGTDSFAGQATSGSLSITKVAPNPTTRQVVVAFESPAQSHVALEIYDAQGRNVATAFSSEFAPGGHVRTVDLGELGIPSGTYYLRISNGHEQSQERVVLLR